MASCKLHILSRNICQWREGEESKLFDLLSHNSFVQIGVIDSVIEVALCMETLLTLCCSEEYNVDEVLLTALELGRIASCCKAFRNLTCTFRQKQKFLADCIAEKLKWEAEIADARTRAWLDEQSRR